MVLDQAGVDMKPDQAPFRVSNPTFTIGQNLAAFTMAWWEYGTTDSATATFGSTTPAPIGYYGSGVHPKAFWLLGGLLGVRVWIGSTAYSTTFATPARGPLNEWHHYAVVLDAVALTGNVYRDGSLVHSGAINGVSGTFTASHTAPLNLGWGLVGDLQDVRFYTRALSAEEVRHIAIGAGRDRVFEGRIWWSRLIHVPGATWDNTRYERVVSNAGHSDVVYVYPGPPTPPSNVATQRGICSPTPRRHRRIG